ncbi:MAG: TlpA family protein disulfide reductase [Acidimicrobiales bacterium]
MDTTESNDHHDEPADHEGDAAGRRTSRSVWLIVGAAAIAAVAVLAVFASGDDDAPTSAEAADDLSSLVFTNEDGTDGTLADFQGEPVVLNFFASWCAPCKAELPDFVAVHTEADGAVQFVGVNADLDDETWLAFVDEFALTYPTVFQPNLEIHEELELLGHPATVFLDEDGNVVYSFTGVLSEELLKELIAEHLAIQI